MILCNRCIKAIRSRGETIYAGDLIHDGEILACSWCDEPDDELYSVEFEKDSVNDELERDDEFDEEHGEEI